MSRPRRGPRARRPGRDRRRERPDDGQLVLLVLVYTLIAVALLAVVASATAVHLARHRLQAVADGAALDAADALDRQRFYAVGTRGGLPDSGTVPVATATVRDSVTRYLAGADEALAIPGLAVVEPTGSPDALTAEVSLAAAVRVPLIAPLLAGWAPGLQVAVSSRAQARAALT